MSSSESLLDGFEAEDEWSKRCGINPRTTLRYRLNHGLPWVKFGNRIYIDTAAAREWLTSRVVRKAPPKRSR